MDYRRLGASGLSVSSICLGTMQFGWTANEATSLKVLDAAFEAGVNFIDTANMYSRWVDGNPGGVSEQILGTWFEQNPGLRERVILATKVRGPMGEGPLDQGLSRKHILTAVRASLERMRTTYIDLYQLHYPDEETPIEETLDALTGLIRRGLVHNIGCSNFTASQLVEALNTSERTGRARFVSLQPHYNLIHRAEYERELRSVCERYDLGVMPYSPLGRGFLTGKYTREGTQQSSGKPVSGRIKRYLQDQSKMDVLEAVASVAAESDASPSQVSLAWLLAQKTVTSVIIGPRTVEQLKDNLGALKTNLSTGDLESLSEKSDWS